MMQRPIPFRITALSRVLSAILVAALTLTGCQSVPPKAAIAPLPTSASFAAKDGLIHAQTSAEKSASSQPWWQQNLSADWQAEIAQVLRNNPYILGAAADVAKAQADLDAAIAAQAWQLTLNGSASATQTDGEGSSRLSTALDATLPLDLFDRLALSEAAQAYRLAVALAELEQARLDQVETYLLAAIDAAEAAERQTLLNEQLATANTLTQLTELRFTQGLISSVDVLQQREQRAALAQQQPAVELQLRQARHGMAEQQGEPPSSRTSLGTNPKQVGPKPVQVATNFSASTPRQLLDQRPDLIAARAELAAADKAYDAQIRARLPSIDLSAQALLRSLSGDTSAVLNIALDAAAALWDSGRWEAASAAEAAERQAAAQAYLQAWLKAVRQTEDLLSEHAANAQQLERSAQRLEVAKDLFAATERRYRRGISDYLPVLGALRGLQQQQRDHLALQTEQQRIRVRLHSAMGLTQAQPPIDQHEIDHRKIDRQAGTDKGDQR